MAFKGGSIWKHMSALQSCPQVESKERHHPDVTQAKSQGPLKSFLSEVTCICFSFAWNWLIQKFRSPKIIACSQQANYSPLENFLQVTSGETFMLFAKAHIGCTWASVSLGASGYPLSDNGMTFLRWDSFSGSSVCVGPKGTTGHTLSTNSRLYFLKLKSGWLFWLISFHVFPLLLG